MSSRCARSRGGRARRACSGAGQRRAPCHGCRCGGRAARHARALKWEMCPAQRRCPPRPCCRERQSAAWRGLPPRLPLAGTPSSCGAAAPGHRARWCTRTWARACRAALVWTAGFQVSVLDEVQQSRKHDSKRGPRLLKTSSRDCALLGPLISAAKEDWRRSSACASPSCAHARAAFIRSAQTSQEDYSAHTPPQGQ